MSKPPRLIQPINGTFEQLMQAVVEDRKLKLSKKNKNQTKNDKYIEKYKKNN